MSFTFTTLPSGFGLASVLGLAGFAAFLPAFEGIFIGASLATFVPQIAGEAKRK